MSPNNTTIVRSGAATDFRPDVEGLRGLAVLLIVAFHAGLLSDVSIKLTGGFIGVDLFFVVSGYLITGQLIRERAATGRIGAFGFYSRRVRRILPAAATMLAITIPVAYVVANPLLRPSTMEDAAAAALSAANVRFAITTDYFNSPGLSPFLHFWSLGVEEQFYLVWPALVAVVLWRGPKTALCAALAAVVIVSFAGNVVVTRENPSWAFFMLPTRAWQLAAGGLLAALSGVAWRTALPHRVGLQVLAAAGWLALVAVIVDAIELDSASTPYPGFAALVPTIAGVLLILSGPLPHGPGMFLRLAPARFFGRISYSLYLWHWPLLILSGVSAQSPIPFVRVLAIVALSTVVATLSWRFVEEPFRRGSIRLPEPRRLVAGGVGVMLVLGLLSVTFGSAARTTLLMPNTFESAVGAATAAEIRPAASREPFALDATTRPAPAAAPFDVEATRHGCVAGLTDVTPNTDCVFGLAGARQSAVLIGDSHASALFPAVLGVADAHSWELRTYLKVGCPFVDALAYSFTLKREYSECAIWTSLVLDELQASPPNVILLAMSRADSLAGAAGHDDTSMGLAMGRAIEKMPRQSRVVIIQDPPLPGFNVPECLASHLDDFRKCSYARANGFYALGIREKIASETAGVPVVSLRSEICPGSGDCPVVIRNVIVWRDEQHLTATFAATLSPVLDARLMAVLGPEPPGTANPPNQSRPTP